MFFQDTVRCKYCNSKFIAPNTKQSECLLECSDCENIWRQDMNKFRKASLYIKILNLFFSTVLLLQALVLILILSLKSIDTDLFIGINLNSKDAENISFNDSADQYVENVEVQIVNVSEKPFNNLFINYGSSYFPIKFVDKYSMTSVPIEIKNTDNIAILGNRYEIFLIKLYYYIASFLKK